jgi:Uma2 family endonuclease
MTLDVRHHRYSLADYLAREKVSPEKHEFRDGEILLMAGGSADHSLVIANVIRALGNLLSGKPCQVFDSNLRVRIPRTVLYTYPDATVICGPRTVDPNDPTGETITNPKLIVEVLSPATEAYDRGEKFARYRQIDSFDEYVLVSLAAARIETFYRPPLPNDASSVTERPWLISTISGTAATAKLRSLNLDLSLAEVYRGIELPAAPELL